MISCRGENSTDITHQKKVIFSRWASLSLIILDISLLWWIFRVLMIYGQHNAICHSPKLSKFDHTEAEKSMEKFDMGNAMMCVQESEEVVICASPAKQSNLHNFLSRSQSRTLSTASSTMSDVSESCKEDFYSQSLPEDNFLTCQGHTGRAFSLYRHELMSPVAPHCVAKTDKMIGTQKKWICQWIIG